VRRQIYKAPEQVVQASSGVECFNSLLRPYTSVKKYLSQGFLAWVAIYRDMRPLKRPVVRDRLGLYLPLAPRW